MAEILCTLGCTLLVKYRMLKTQEQQTAGRSKAVASVATILESMNPVLEFKNSTLNFLIYFVNSSREYY